MNDLPLAPNPSDAPIDPQPAAPATTSLLARMTNVVATPSEVFDEIKASPPASANWVIPALLLMVVGWICGWLVMSQDAVRQQVSDIQEKQYQKLIDQGKMTRDQLEAQRPMMEKFGRIAQQVAMAAMPPLTAFALPFWWALVIWLVGNKALKGDFSYMKAVEASGLVSILLILESVVKTLLIIVLGNMFAGPNLGLFVKGFDPTNVAHGLLAAVDVLALWVLAVRAIALSRLSGASFGVSAAWVFGLWVLATGGLTAFGYAMQRIFSGGGH